MISCCAHITGLITAWNVAVCLPEAYAAKLCKPLIFRNATIKICPNLFRTFYIEVDVVCFSSFNSYVSIGQELETDIKGIAVKVLLYSPLKCRM